MTYEQFCEGWKINVGAQKPSEENFDLWKQMQ